MLTHEVSHGPIDLSQTYTLLHSTGDVEKIQGGNKFWQAPKALKNRAGQLWLLSEHHYNLDWDDWKKHPAGDEIIYLLSGSMDVVIHADTKPTTIQLRTNGVITIPRGVWYTIKVYNPCHVLNISREFNTKLKKII